MRRRELHLSSVAGKWHEKAIEKLKNAISIGKQNSYETARIMFEAQDNKSHTVRVNTETMNIIGDAFVKKHRLSGFSYFLNEADDKINEEIKKKMVEIFNNTQG